MLLLLLKISIDLFCGFCKYIGELYFHDVERYIIPPMIVLGIYLDTHIWWLGIPSLLMIGDLVEGYGVNSWMCKLLGDAGAQGMWMFGACFLAGIAPLLTNHLIWDWKFFVGWCVLAGVMGATTRNLNNKVVSGFKGIWMGLIIFFVR